MNIIKYINNLYNKDTNENNNNKYPHHTTIYKFYKKLAKYNIISITYDNLVNKYINKHKCNKFIIDSTFINNKQGTT
jgi:hypothetical protein